MLLSRRVEVWNGRLISLLDTRTGGNETRTFHCVEWADKSLKRCYQPKDREVIIMRGRMKQGCVSGLLALALACVLVPTVKAEDPEECGPALKKKERKQVAVVKVEDRGLEEAVQAAEEETGQTVEILFSELFSTDRPKVEKAVQKEAAKRGCRVALITEVEKVQVGQRPVRVGGVGGATIPEAVFRYDVRAHYGRLADSKE